MSAAPSAPGKIRSAHLERLAVVYVRQSSLAQVREHGESTARQYALADEAARLGWSAEQTLVIDADLGLSGRDGWGSERRLALAPPRRLEVTPTRRRVFWFRFHS